MASVFASLGLTRDSWLWLFGKVSSIALLVTSGLFDPHLGGFDPGALGISEHSLHWIQLASIVVLYLSGQMSTSRLPGADQHDAIGVGRFKNPGVPIVLLAVLTLTVTGCASMPPNLTPAAATAWHQTEAQKPLDLLRDMAIDANAQTPPLVSTKATTTIVTWHRASIITIHAVPNGWQSTVRTGLDQALNGLTPAERAALQPYVQLVEAILSEVTQ